MILRSPKVHKTFTNALCRAKTTLQESVVYLSGISRYFIVQVAERWHTRMKVYADC